MPAIFSDTRSSDHLADLLPVLERFEQAWQSQTPPDIEAFAVRLGIAVAA